MNATEQIVVEKDFMVFEIVDAPPEQYVIEMLFNSNAYAYTLFSTNFATGNGFTPLKIRRFSSFQEATFLGNIHVARMPNLKSWQIITVEDAIKRGHDIKTVEVL